MITDKFFEFWKDSKDYATVIAPLLYTSENKWYIYIAWFRAYTVPKDIDVMEYSVKYITKLYNSYHILIKHLQLHTYSN